MEILKLDMAFKTPEAREKYEDELTEKYCIFAIFNSEKEIEGQKYYMIDSINYFGRR